MAADMPNEHPQTNRQTIFGWVLFVVCALFFMAAAWKNRDLLTFLGSVIFLVACLVFLVPLVRSAARSHDDTRNKAP
jgi:cell division protein FtsW (lipid II flippase)